MLLQVQQCKEENTTHTSNALQQNSFLKSNFGKMLLLVFELLPIDEGHFNSSEKVKIILSMTPIKQEKLNNVVLFSLLPLFGNSSICKLDITKNSLLFFKHLKVGFRDVRTFNMEP